MKNVKKVEIVRIEVPFHLEGKVENFYALFVTWDTGRKQIIQQGSLDALTLIAKKFSSTHIVS